jgi:type II secretory ATPase GspE/PulE/Tfp pilus assembly ATPase PilB-like protein
MNNVRKILAACDFADSDETVRRASCALAEKMGAELHLLHVLSKKDQNGNTEETIRYTKERLERLLSPEQVLKLSCKWAVCEGPTADQIIRYADENAVDLVVVGARDRSGINRLVKHDIAVEILKTVSCPVLVVPHRHGTGRLSLQQAGKALQEQFGDSFTGDRDMTRLHMKELLEQHFDLSSNDAETILMQLETAGALMFGQSSQYEDDEESENADVAWRIDPQVVTDVTYPQLLDQLEPTSAATPALDLLERARATRATDIHIDPIGDNRCSVRFRIDGSLEHYCDLDADLAAHLLQQFKILADINIAEPFRPHEGRLQLPHLTWDCQVRITTSPVAGGESICLRLQEEGTLLRPLSELGLEEKTFSSIEEMLRRGEGIVLVTGPTGVGKTTTVYSMLRELQTSKRHRNIVTIEDPVEFDVPFLRQMSIDDTHGITLTSGLRTMLRMDPDIIFVGEIRDGHTAEMAMRAASSGKYVFSTLHTRDVASTVTALRDLGISPRSLAGNLTGIISQRLVRRICPTCRQRQPTPERARQLLAEHGLEAPTELYVASGCDHCRGRGYRGRIGIFEVAVAHRLIVDAIEREAPEDELRGLIRSTETDSLATDGFRKVLEGHTSIEEVERMQWM